MTSVSFLEYTDFSTCSLVDQILHFRFHPRCYGIRNPFVYGYPNLYHFVIDLKIICNIL